MIAFKITINNNKIVYAGISTGVVSVIFHYISRIDPKQINETFLHAGGLDTITNCHLNWIKHLKIRKNDKFEIEVVDVEKCSRIVSKKYNDDIFDEKYKNRQLKAMAKEMGYKLIKSNANKLNKKLS